MRIISRIFLFALIMALLSTGTCLAAEKDKSEEKKPARPPSLVEVLEVQKGDAEPMFEYVGSVYYARKSRVASEVEGVVEDVKIEEGDHVKRYSPLVSLSADILDTVIIGTRAEHDQVLVELEQAAKELQRREPLLKEGSVSESAYDEYFFKSKRLTNQALTLQASLDRLLLEKEKKNIKAPFNGIVMEKSVEQGEWVHTGGTIAVIADDSEIDVVVDVQAGMLQYLQAGREIEITAADLKLIGKFVSFVPKGDVATRTFSIKIRLKNPDGLVEGMEARALLPTASRQKSLLVPRDALVVKFGKNAVFIVEEGKAKMVPVAVQGYSGLMVGVAGPGLEAGQQVVVKGNERLFGGEQLVIRQ